MEDSGFDSTTGYIQWANRTVPMVAQIVTFRRADIFACWNNLYIFSNAQKV